MKNLCIDNPDVMWQLIKKHRWQYLQFVTKKDMPKLFLIKDFIKRPEKYENYWQKKMYGPEEDQLTLF